MDEELKKENIKSIIDLNGRYFTNYIIIKPSFINIEIYQKHQKN